MDKITKFLENVDIKNFDHFNYQYRYSDVDGYCKYIERSMKEKNAFYIN